VSSIQEKETLHQELHIPEECIFISTLVSLKFDLVITTTLESSFYKLVSPYGQMIRLGKKNRRIDSSALSYSMEASFTYAVFDQEEIFRKYEHDTGR
jgi:hypothetical protein